MEQNEMISALAAAVAAEGGRAYYVGGCVRDKLLARPQNDIDIEIHGILPDRLRELLACFGTPMEIGKSFGVFGIKGYDVDIALPRTEQLTGRHHRDFAVQSDPFIGTRRAAARRDFTVNALMEDVLTGEIIDHFGGRADLQNQTLHYVRSSTFGEDALRVLRGAQFAARFGFRLSEPTVWACRRMDLSALSHERVAGEMKKALLCAPKPSVFFEVLRRVGQLDTWFAPLAALIGVPQNPKYHPEGDVWAHTMRVLDAAAALRDRAHNPYALMLAALCHDFGKPATTKWIKEAWRSYGHETAGVPIAHDFVRHTVGDKELTRQVCNLVELHMRPGALSAQNAGEKSTNRMFDAALCPEDLILLSIADRMGRDDHTEFLQARLQIYKELMSRPQVTGADLIAAGLTPDEHFSQLLARAHEMHLAGVPKSEALRQTLALAGKNAGKARRVNED